MQYDQQNTEGRWIALSLVSLVTSGKLAAVWAENLCHINNTVKAMKLAF